MDQIAPGGFTMQAPIVNTSNSNDLLKNSPKIELTKSRWLYWECVKEQKVRGDNGETGAPKEDT